MPLWEGNVNLKFVWFISFAARFYDPASVALIQEDDSERTSNMTSTLFFIMLFHTTMYFAVLQLPTQIKHVTEMSKLA